MTADRRPPEARDAGFTLIELVVSTALFAMIFVVIGGVFITLIRTQQTVAASATAATDGQLAASSIEAGVRNASEFRVTSVGADQLLVARTASTGTALEWRCAAWYYSAADGGSIRTTSTDGSPIPAPSSAQLAGWTLLVSGVAPRNPAGVFIESGSELTVAFDAAADGAEPTAIEFTVIPFTRAVEASTCY